MVGRRHRNAFIDEALQYRLAFSGNELGDYRAPIGDEHTLTCARRLHLGAQLRLEFPNADSRHDSPQPL